MLSIIIPAFNAEKTLPGLLGSIYRSDFKDYEVIVVDDFSKDTTPSIMKNYPVKGIFLSSHSGPAQARNKGAGIAKGEVLVFFDADIEIEPVTLSKIAKRFEENPDKKVLVGTYSDEPLNAGYFPRFKALWFKSLFNNAATQTDSLEGFCVAIDKEAFHSVGGFNGGFVDSGIEDYEFGCRLRQKYRIYFDANIQVRHIFPGFFKNAAKFFRRSYDFMPLFLSQDRNSRGAALNRDGFACVISFVSFLLLPFVCNRHFPSIFLFLICIIFFILFGRKFIKLLFSKEGLLFAIASIFTYYINAVIVGLGIALGTLRYILTLR